MTSLPVSWYYDVTHIIARSYLYVHTISPTTLCLHPTVATSLLQCSTTSSIYVICVNSVMASGEDDTVIEGRDMPYIDYEDDMSELPPYQPSIHHQEQMMTEQSSSWGSGI